MTKAVPTILEHPGIAALIESLRARPEVERIVLFGSRARGDNAERSDVDLAIAAPTATRRQWSDIMELAENARTLLMIDVVRLEKAPVELRAEIERCGYEVYAR